MIIDECPFCKSKTLSRVPRKGWMHLIPGSRRYDCVICQAEVVTVLGRFQIKLSEGHSKLINLNKMFKEEQVAQKIS
ncbi:MAG: hypothetical protein ACTSWD_10820 [Candidatus Heimdallarchaeota archaeon]